MSRWSTQRENGGGGVHKTTPLPQYRNVAALAPSLDSMRMAPTVCVKMEWDTCSVRAHRPRCQHPVLNGREQSVQWMPRNDTGPVGGSPTRPWHQEVSTRMWRDGVPPILERPKYMRQRPHTALERPRTVYGAIWRTRTLKVLETSRTNTGMTRERQCALAGRTYNRRHTLGVCHHS